MSIKKLTMIFIVPFLAGAAIGYMVFPDFAALLLLGLSAEYTLIATEVSDVFIIRALFTIFMGLAFVSIPLSAFVSIKFASTEISPARFLGFTVIMLLFFAGYIFYYQNYFAHLFTALELKSGISIRLDMIPYYRIPLLSAVVTLMFALLYLGASVVKSRNN